MDTTEFDFCVVGAGLMGSAAAKHLQLLNASSRVILVGPSEPKDREKTDIFGAYYDEGRIARELDADPVWDVLDRGSVSNYHEIAAKTGVNFFTECGWLVLATPEQDTINRCKHNASTSGLEVLTLDERELRRRYPYLRTPQGTTGLLLPERAGYINPRIFVQAQQQIARDHGCRTLDDIVNSVHRTKTGKMTLMTKLGKKITARKVLLATGAFTGCRNLLPASVKPEMTPTTETVLFVRIPEGMLNRFRGMPGISSSIRLSSGTLGYVLPPIKYPDGHNYIKVGHFRDFNFPLRTTELTPWYRGHFNAQREKTKRHLVTVFSTIFPEIPLDHYHFDYCSTTPTSTNYPFIDLIHPGLGVAVGGCGVSAKCADEIGKIAARMVTKGSWDYEPLPSSLFKFRNKCEANL